MNEDGFSFFEKFLVVIFFRINKFNLCIFLRVTIWFMRAYSYSEINVITSFNV